MRRNGVTLTRDIGLLLTRGAIGASLMAHGAQKAFGTFGGPGLSGTAGFMEALRFSPGQRFATLAAVSELGGGALLALGLGGPLAATVIVSTMTVAAGSVHAKNGFFAQNNGVELPALYAVAAAVLALSGPGEMSLDNTFGFEASDARLAWAAVLAGVAAGAIALAQRQPAPPPADAVAGSTPATA